jgi:carbon-monoxide dehydrogenase medium subunit
MYEFEYLTATSVADAAARLAANSDAKLLAGGQTLIAAMKLRLTSPAQLIDLRAIPDIKGVCVEGNAVVIGAMTTHAEVAASADVQRLVPALGRLAGGIGDRMVRNMGTLGGSVANNDPAADYPAGLVGLGATVTTNKRKIAADDFFRSMYETALQPGEIVTSVSFPVPKRAAYIKFPNPASRYALVGVFVAETANGARVAVTGAGPSVFRVPDMEQALSKRFAPESVANIQIAAAPLNTDLHASAEYRAHLVTVLAKRAVEQALA